jgi:hypothetical protein
MSLGRDPAMDFSVLQIFALFSTRRIKHQTGTWASPGDQYRVGARRASWSKVRHSPPALTILALAVSVKLRAHTYLHRRHLVDPLVVGHGAHDHSDQIALHSG